MARGHSKPQSAGVWPPHLSKHSGNEECLDGGCGGFSSHFDVYLYLERDQHRARHIPPALPLPSWRCLPPPFLLLPGEEGRLCWGSWVKVWAGVGERNFYF